MAHASSHYELLGVDQQASPEQVKAAYQKLVLTLHPDKAGEDSQERFQQLQQAWQVSSHASSRAGLSHQPGSGDRRSFIVMRLQTLRDPSSRLLYDHQLTQAELRATVVLHDEVELSDMEPGSPTNGPASCQQCTYPCRCGDSYVLTPADMRLAAHTQQIILPCR